MMLNLEYIKDAASLSLDREACTGCGMCLTVCPHGVFEFRNGTAAASKRRAVEIVFKDRCMECGACMMNCPAGAIAVKKGVGCAAAVIASRLAGREEITCGCGGEEGCSEEADAVNSGCGCGAERGAQKGSIVDTGKSG